MAEFIQDLAMSSGAEDLILRRFPSSTQLPGLTKSSLVAGNTKYESKTDSSKKRGKKQPSESDLMGQTSLELKTRGNLPN